MSFYIYETQYKHARTCDKCGKGMSEGYIHDTGGDTYCSNDCLDKGIPEPEQTDLILEGTLFWTTWHDEVNP